MLLFGIVPAILCAISYAELRRNRAILTHGPEVQALVIKARQEGYRRICTIGYRFRVGLAEFGGEAVSCPLIRAYPVGTLLPVRHEPGNPARSLPVGASAWPGLGLPALILALAMVLTPAWLLSSVLLVVDRLRSRRREAKPVH